MITLIVPAHLRDTAAALCEQIAGPAGAGMFITPLYSDSAEPSHYISTGWIADEFSDALHCTVATEDGEETRPADLGALQVMADVAGVPFDAEQVEALLGQCYITTDPWRDAVERLGLSLEVQHDHQA